ncbi:hypothetical protein BGI41_02815 [Methanobrevibacter sp. 87.7]|uniref:alpha/beta hydrolase family protein n=1 Tax=Methanobrevibacter sp. 87.7 TaxID=387957 RepID=UPI000B6CA1F8|nr:alpha/beta fold hydrolase [Methanobrevibacter sp. 87.7]OWT33361.1 hypothetical protein BGI41_02815 [Methanobrevibacter sp. 87.7]
MIKDFNCKLNNENINGLMYVPDDLPGKVPTIILSHGLSLNYTYMIPYAEKLLNYGIASIVFDFRGGGYDCKSDGKISDMSPLTEIDDLNCVIDNVKKLDFVDSNKLYLAGHSQGGLVSSLIAPSRSDDISALFLFAPAYVIPDDTRNLDNMREDNVLTLMPEYLGEKYIKDSSSINLYDDIKDYKKPVFIFHGKLDQRVPVSYAINADKEYKNSHLFIFDNEPHRFSDETKDIVVSEINKFIFD